MVMSGSATDAESTHTTTRPSRQSCSAAGASRAGRSHRGLAEPYTRRQNLRAGVTRCRRGRVHVAQELERSPRCRVSRHENARRGLCPGSVLGSGDPGQGLLLGERRRVGRFGRWASSPGFSFGRPCDLPGLCCEHVSVCVVVPLVLPFVRCVGGGEDGIVEVDRPRDRLGRSP